MFIYQVSALKWRLWGCFINADRILKARLSYLLIPLPVSPELISFSTSGRLYLRVCALAADYPRSFSGAKHVIMASSSLFTNSVGSACQTAYAGRVSDFEMLLMAVGCNCPPSLTLPHPHFLALSCQLL